MDKMILTLVCFPTCVSETDVRKCRGQFRKIFASTPSPPHQTQFLRTSNGEN